MVLIILGAFGSVPAPFYSFIFKCTYATLFSLKLPYFNRYPSTEFVINITWETFNSIIGVGIVLLIEVMMALCNDTISVSSELTELDLNELSDLLEQNNASQAKQIFQLKKILMKVSHIDEYVKILHTAFSISSFIFVITGSPNPSEMSCTFAILWHRRHSPSQLLSRSIANTWYEKVILFSVHFSFFIKL